MAQASTVFSRIARGTRTDYVEVFDPASEPSIDELAGIDDLPECRPLSAGGRPPGSPAFPIRVRRPLTWHS
ncbi:amine dehydrogenase large subunit [Paracoccus mutanolyticus]|uniref:amine dehydrogenase large subunit n=1 Tax=Paracoccus mutanolyticus TaxID=1499308 RepID=UPI001CB93DB0|nr:amine dehydrogenase large subunit [Paracoccus mutanolyticus]